MDLFLYFTMKKSKITTYSINYPIYTKNVEYLLKMK